MVPLLLALSTSLSAPAHAKDLRVPAVDVVVHVPDPVDGEEYPWGWTVGDASMDVRLSLRNTLAYTDITFSATPWQPDLDAVADVFAASVIDTSDEALQITPGGVERVEHEKLGSMLLVTASVRDTFMEQDLFQRTVMFNVEATGVVVSALSSESAERATEVLDSVLAMVEVTSPAIPKADLRTGKITADAGYTLELPPGWRALTAEEARRLSTDRIGGDGPFAGRRSQLFVVDAASMSRQVFGCVADTNGSLEILDPTKSERAAENFRTYARVRLKGGRYKLINGTDEAFIDVLSEASFIPTTEGELKLLPLGEREAYLWRLDGKVYDSPASASVFYTTYDDVELTCVAIAEPDRVAELTTFDGIVSNLRVVDGMLYEMPMSLRARYIRWWPTTNPFLQLYWLPLPLFLLAGWLVTRD